MNDMPNVDPHLVRAAAFFTLWRTASSSSQPSIQAMIRQAVQSTPPLRVALEQVANVYRRVLHPDPQSISPSDRIPILASDISIFVAMHNGGVHARALAFVVAWRGAEPIQRAAIEQLIRIEVQQLPSFRHNLASALTQVEKYMVQGRDPHAFAFL